MFMEPLGRNATSTAKAAPGYPTGDLNIGRCAWYNECVTKPPEIGHGSHAAMGLPFLSESIAMGDTGKAKRRTKKPAANAVSGVRT
jgi:hypothetical protein